MPGGILFSLHVKLNYFTASISLMYPNFKLICKQKARFGTKNCMILLIYLHRKKQAGTVITSHTGYTDLHENKPLKSKFLPLLISLINQVAKRNLIQNYMFYSTL